MNLEEATVLALQGKLPLYEAKIECHNPDSIDITKGYGNLLFIGDEHIEVSEGIGMEPEIEVYYEIDNSEIIPTNIDIIIKEINSTSRKDGKSITIDDIKTDFTYDNRKGLINYIEELGTEFYYK